MLSILEIMLNVDPNCGEQLKCYCILSPILTMREDNILDSTEKQTNQEKHGSSTRESFMAPIAFLANPPFHE